MNIRNRTPSSYISYVLYLYFLGLSLRQVSERLSCFIKRNHVSVWNWIQKHKPVRTISSIRKMFFGFVIDETLFEVVSGYNRLALGCQAKKEQIIARSNSKERNIVCCRGLP
jgi:putative transposase